MSAVDRPLTDEERHLLNEVIVWKIRHNIAGQAGVDVTHESTCIALDDLIEKHGMHREYDAHHVHITTGQQRGVILRVAREWLAFHASHDEQITEDELERAISTGDIA